MLNRAGFWLFGSEAVSEPNVELTTFQTSLRHAQWNCSVSDGLGKDDIGSCDGLGKDVIGNCDINTTMQQRNFIKFLHK